jgi:hypothetical protein
MPFTEQRKISMESIMLPGTNRPQIPLTKLISGWIGCSTSPHASGEASARGVFMRDRPWPRSTHRPLSHRSTMSCLPPGKRRDLLNLKGSTPSSRREQRKAIAQAMGVMSHSSKTNACTMFGVAAPSLTHPETGPAVRPPTETIHYPSCSDSPCNHD